jgi:GrpB-like predicted nucleotidyltransferase (UPF0157 family)
MLGLPKGEVFLLDSTDEWAKEFDSESGKIIDIIDDYIYAIHHIGSTAVAGLKAKPIIDIAIEIHEFELGYKCIEPLNSLGYKHRIIPELPDRHYWSKGEPRTHQIHMYAKGSKYLHQQLLFRDKLQEDSKLRTAYEALKVDLSNKNKNDKLTYADSKTNFIMSVVG